MKSDDAVAVEVSPLEENRHFCKQIARELFQEWHQDYIQLTPWKTEHSLYLHYHDVIASPTAPTTPTAPTSYTMNANNEDTSEGSSYALVAHVGDEFVGCVVNTGDDMGMKPELSPWMAVVFVKSQFRGRGIASMLISRLLGECRLKRLYLWTFSQQFASFYERFGFQTIEIVPEHGQYRNVYVMACDIPKLEYLEQQ